jgi:hypothetical protein
MKSGIAEAKTHAAESDCLSPACPGGGIARVMQESDSENCIKCGDKLTRFATGPIGPSDAAKAWEFFRGNRCASMKTLIK